MPDGRRRRDLQDRFRRFVANAFALRILDYDEPAARCYGEIMAACRAKGRPISVPDGQIAAIAKVHSSVVATRNVRGFEHGGIELVDSFAGE